MYGLSCILNLSYETSIRASQVLISNENWICQAKRKSRDCYHASWCNFCGFLGLSRFVLSIVITRSCYVDQSCYKGLNSWGLGIGLQWRLLTSRVIVFSIDHRPKVSIERLMVLLF